jgi:hypothetical protein
MDEINDKEEAIRTRAYEIWERDGRPHGLSEDHWHRAAHEIASEGDAASEDEDNTGIMDEALDIPPEGTMPRGGQSSAGFSTEGTGSSFVTSATTTSGTKAS